MWKSGKKVRILQYIDVKVWGYDCKVVLHIRHSKNEQIGGDPLLSTEKLAEKVRISGRQYFGTKVR